MIVNDYLFVLIKIHSYTFIAKAKLKSAETAAGYSVIDYWAIYFLRGTFSLRGVRRANWKHLDASPWWTDC